MMRSLKMEICVAYGEFLLFIRPVVERLPKWVQSCYVGDLEDLEEYISGGGR